MAKFSNYFKFVAPSPSVTTVTDNQGIGDASTYSNTTWYQRLIQGSASRITRYREYDLMDQDIEIARSLDTIAEEMVGSDPNRDLPLELVIASDKQDTIPQSTVLTLKAALQYWCDLHDWHSRLFNVSRVLIKYGDCPFIRRSPTSKWEYVHPKSVVAAIVDDHDITKIVAWHVRRDTKIPNSPYTTSAGAYGTGQQDNIDVIPASDMVMFTLNDDMSESAPFGESVLRAVYRAHKQKELLEDAILIYRIQRAPERRVFYVDVGKMPPQRVKTYLEGIKNEIRQRKIPTTGGGANQVDSVYNPQSMNEDFFFAQRADGKGSRVETLPGGASVGEVGDLEYFQAKVFRGLRIPLSYMQEGSEGATFNDGKVGTAYIQELRFAMYVKRLQGHVSHILDDEFKRYIKHTGISADPSMFYISLPEPENFGVYRQQELDNSLLNTFQTATGITFLSPRFIMKRYLQLTEEEVLTNERLRLEEMGLPANGSKASLRVLYGNSEEMTAGGAGGGDIGGMSAGMPGMDFEPDEEPTETPDSDIES